MVILGSFFFGSGLVANPNKPDLTVAKDGSGNYRTVQEAFNAAPDKSLKRFVIFIKNGVYKEKLVLPSSKENIAIVGERLQSVVLTYDDYSKRVVGGDTIITPTSYSFLIKSNGFFAENITFENSAGRVGQAVAVMVSADKAIFKDCRFLGNQDVLFVETLGRCYFTNCYIEGTTDFIFGSAIALFENCQIHSKKNSFVTAASTPQGNKFGYVFRNCNLTSDTGMNRVFLGRPWRPYARVVYLECTLGNHIFPVGWDNWRKPENEKTAYYAEFKSRGPGANPQARASWSYQLSEVDAGRYSVEHVFAKDAAVVPFADDWNPATTLNYMRLNE